MGDAMLLNMMMCDNNGRHSSRDDHYYDLSPPTRRTISPAWKLFLRASGVACGIVMVAVTITSKELDLVMKGICLVASLIVPVVSFGITQDPVG
ncbi:unnamed protein product [Urochloa decumbens]|uniref:Uncharacterized protein n=1 Tax=Urochloa decumbens TaxID=240449 RepID=A0ABC8YPT1_9POAL